MPVAPKGRKILAPEVDGRYIFPADTCIFERHPRSFSPYLGVRFVTKPAEFMHANADY
jgi:hypothetical protein